MIFSNWLDLQHLYSLPFFVPKWYSSLADTTMKKRTTFFISITEQLLNTFVLKPLAPQKPPSKLTYVGSLSAHNLWWVWQRWFYTHISGHGPEGALLLCSVNFFREDIALPVHHNWCHLILYNAKQIFFKTHMEIAESFKMFWVNKP